MINVTKLTVKHFKAVSSAAHLSKCIGHTSNLQQQHTQCYCECVCVCVCVRVCVRAYHTDLNDLLGVQPEVEVAEDEVGQPLEALIRDPAERLRRTRSVLDHQCRSPT